MKEEPLRLPWQLFLAEVTGTGLLVMLGLSSVILMFGVGNPFEQFVPSPVIRRSLSGIVQHSRGDHGRGGNDLLFDFHSVLVSRISPLRRFTPFAQFCLQS
ncbi:MAG TPA: hypothetical protein VJ372_24370 [Pyrinomonadaceae bacterium]|jgi:hypothetical protein|nr:hypothetical protein [Pyrinomonadaceae bacterium]